MSDKKQQARHMYMNESCTQRDIAKKLGVTERTVYNWIKGSAWDRLRQAAYAAPVMIAENLCSQLVEMQASIAGREPGKRFPSMQEAEITRKLICGIEKMKKYPSLPQNMQVLASFRRFISPAVDSRFDGTLRLYVERYLEAEATNGYYPYQAEFGLAPLLFDEGPEPETEPETQPEKTGKKEEKTTDEETAIPAPVHATIGGQEAPPQSILTTSFSHVDDFGETLLHSRDTSLSLGEGRGEATHEHSTHITPRFLECPDPAENETPQHSFDLFWRGPG